MAIAPKGKKRPQKDLPSAQPPAKAKRGRRLRVTADLAHGGALHVRHMSDRDVVLDGVAVTLADNSAKRVWIQLAKPGVFRGHPAGPFVLDDKVFDDIVRNFKATENRAIPIDFEHASESDATEGSIPVEGAPAQGWIHDLKIDGGNLWGLVEWGDRARQYILNGQYKFFSPAIRFGAKDRVTGNQIGARMTSGALTNNPFLDGMKPLAAKDAAAETDDALTLRLAHSPGEYMPRIRGILGLSELSTARDCADQFQALRDHFDAAGGDPNGSHEGIGLGKFCYAMRDLVGATPGDTWEEIFDVVEELIEAVVGEPDDGAEMDDDAGSGVDMNDSGTAAQETNAMFKDIAEATAKFNDAQGEISKLTLTLRDRDAKLGELETEVKTLRDEKSKRDEADLSAEVDEAFAVYKDAKKLSDKDKGHMLTMLKAAPDAFRGLYPKIAPEHRHLQRNLTDHREAPAEITDTDGAHVDTRIMSETFGQTVNRLMTEKKLSYLAASNLASKLRAA